MHGCGNRQVQTSSLTLTPQLSHAAFGSLTCRRQSMPQAKDIVSLQLDADQSDMSK